MTVHMFDRDLQDVIREGNKLFIQQALERAAEVEEEAKAVTRSDRSSGFLSRNVTVEKDDRLKASAIWFRSPQASESKPLPSELKMPTTVQRSPPNLIC